MSYTPSFQIGDIVSNDILRTEFRAGDMEDIADKV